MNTYGILQFYTITYVTESGTKQQLQTLYNGLEVSTHRKLAMY